MSGDGWWAKEPKDRRQGCAVALLGAALGWLAVGLAVWAAVRWWAP